MSSNTTNLTVTVAGAAALVVVLGAIWFGVGASATPPDPTARSVASASTVLTVRIHVSGAVAAPGVVELAADSIVADAVRAAGGATRTADLAALNLAATLRGGERVIVPEVQQGGARSAPVDDSGIDLNTATASELETLPGVGPVLAARIVAHRTDSGAFLTVEDLLGVPGIGEAKLASMRDAIARP